MSDHPSPSTESEPPRLPVAAGPILPYISTTSPQSGLSPLELYGMVPLLRRNSFNSRLVLVSLLAWLAAPFSVGLRVLLIPVGLVAISGISLLIVCVMVLTGPVYYPRLGRDGRLQTWGAGNKVVAILFLAVWLITGFAISGTILRRLRM